MFKLVGRQPRQHHFSPAQVAQLSCWSLHPALEGADVGDALSVIRHGVSEGPTGHTGCKMVSKEGRNKT